MPGYNGRTAQANATAVNDQINRQRTAINTTSGLGLDFSSEASPAGMGISRDQSSTIFPGFDGQKIMNDSYAAFLKSVAASNNPDFQEKFTPSLFSSNNKLITTATDSVTEDAVDGPAIGLGPNLKAQDIDRVIAGSVEATGNVKPNLPGGRGFGVTDPDDKGLTMGNYFKHRYSVTGEAGIEVVKGERASVADDPYDYNQ
jgi:hypothetical protein